MSHQVSSAIFNRGLAAWHGEGTVVNDLDLTPRKAFEEANALFTVVKTPLTYSFDDGVSEEPITKPSSRCSLVHTATGEELGTCGKGYEIVQNDRLLEMAEAVSSEIIMDAVVVIDGGRKIAFTGLIKNNGVADVLRNDPVGNFLIGYLGHDGATGISAGFGNVRVVCANTLAAHMSSASLQRTLAHRQGVNLEVSRLIHSINASQRQFEENLEAYEEMTRIACNDTQFDQLLTDLFADQLAVPVKEKGQIVRQRTLNDLRITPSMREAFQAGIGTDIPGVRGTAWGAFNAVSEVLTSQKVAAQNSVKRFDRSFFGVNKRRMALAKELCLAI